MSAPAATTSSSSLPPPTSSSAAHQPEANNASQQQQQQQQQQPQPPGFTPRDPSHAWEAVDGSSLWHDVQEDAHGNILLSSSTAHLSLASQIRQRRHRLASTDISLRSHRLVRHMLRHVYLVLDASRWSREKDASLPPAKVRLETILNLSVEFVNQFYDQNPLGHLGVVLCKDGEAEMLAGLGGGGPGKVKLALGAALVSEMKLTGAKGGGKGTAIGGEFSLQNGIEVAGRSLGYAPRYGSREIVVITSALSTCDPGDILGETLPRLLRAGIRVSTVALQAELHVCKTLADRTGGLAGVCLDRRHLRDLVMGHAVPPPVNARQLNEDEDAGADHDNNSRNNANGQPQMICEFVTMGFPSREGGDVPTLVHNTGGAGGLNDKHGGGGGAVAFAINPAAADDRRSNRLISFARSGYVCPRCRSRCSDLPSDCAVCGLRLILAPHLARTFHHLFPVRPFLELEDAEVVSSVASGLMLKEEEEELKNVKDEGDGELQQIKSQPQPLLQKSQQHTNGKKGLEALPILSSSAYTPISSLSSSCVESFVVTSSSTSMDVPIDNQMSSTNHNNDNNIHTPISKVINIGPSIIANSADCDRCCFGCLKIIGCKPLNAANINGSSSASTTTENTNNRDVSNPTTTAKEAESILRFQCPECLNVFCPDCDAYLHETLHNCPGCLCN